MLTWLVACIDRDPYWTPRAGSFDRVDAVLPWRFEEEREEPVPPPVPPKNDLRARSNAVAAVAASIPERVTPWLLRRVKTPVTQAAPPAPAHVLPQKASASADIRGRGSPKPPKPEPPAYHAVPPLPLQQSQSQPQLQIYPSEERLGNTTRRGPPAAAVVQSQQSTVQVQPRTPPKPAVAAPRSNARGGGGETQRGPTSHSGCPQLRSVRSAPQTDRLRPRAPATRPPPLRPATTVQQQPERAHLPSYHSARPFPSPAPPPYRASAEDSYPTSARSRSLPRSSRRHGGGGPTYEKEVAPPLPLPPLPSQRLPRLSSSAISRIQAGFKVSKDFGDAIMKQELRFATPTSDHSRLDPVPNPRQGRRFLSASELQSRRKAKLCADKIIPEHEARQRPSNMSSVSVGRYSGDSRQRTISAHPGRGRR